MNLKDYIFPCVQILHYVEAKNGLRIAICNTNNEAEELCSILNAHFAKKEEPVKDTPPTPNQAETDIPSGKPCSAGIDRVASDFVLSGRELDVQFFADGRWVDVKADGVKIPSFHYSRHWRIKPTKRRVVVEVYKSPNGNLSAIVRDNDYALPSQYKLLGIIEGEVEV